MFRSIVLLIGGLASLSAVSLFAQDAVLRQSYGSGVHAYFSADYLRAYEKLTAAIKGGSKDPRVFYFRGLTYLKLGRGSEAAMDFRTGAELESRDVNRFYNVGKALERVQGRVRLDLENYRVKARMVVLEKAKRIRKARYEALRREESRVLREQAAAAPTTPVKAARPAPPPAADIDPFATPGNMPTIKPGKKPAKPAIKPEKKPAAKLPAYKAKKPAAKSKAKRPAADKKPVKKIDPDDPFASFAS